MSQDALSGIRELLNEEKWTRASLETHSKKNFAKLDGMIEEVLRSADGVAALKEICDEHRKQHSQSIIADYISGIVLFENKAIESNPLLKTISTFRDAKKWAIVEFLAEKVLTYEENKKALRALAAVYQNTGMDTELWQTWERLVKVDHNNHEIPQKLAQHYEEEEPELSIYYYKLTLRRMLMQNEQADFAQIWGKLASLVPGDIDFFYSLEARIKERLKSDAIGSAFLELLPHYEGQDLENTLRILTTVCRYFPTHKEARKKLVTALREKYAAHSQLENTVTLSGIEQLAKPIDDAFAIFFRKIAFDTGDFVYHRSWGIGQIVSIEAEVFSIDFDKKKGHNMDLDMALKSLQRLPENHIWLLARQDMAALKKMTTEDIETFLNLVFGSFGKELNLKEMKTELLNGKIFSDGEWTSWWNKAKKAFKGNPRFGVSLDKKNVYFLRDKPISIEEESLTRFDAEKDFSRRLQIFEGLLAHTSDGSSPAFQKMAAFFKTRAEAGGAEFDAESLEAALFLNRLAKQYGGRLGDLEAISLEKAYKSLKEPAAILEKLANIENRRMLLALIRRYDPQWEDLYLQILRQAPAQYHTRLLDELLLNDRTDKVIPLINRFIDQYRQDMDNLIWVTRLYYERRDREDAFVIDEERLLAALVNSLVLLDKEIQNKSNVAINRRRYNQISDILFEEQRLVNFIESGATAGVSALLATLSHSVEIISEQQQVEIMRTLRGSHPDIDFSFSKVSDSERALHPFLVTQTSYDKKQGEYKHIVEIDIPENSRDISLAVEKGDLSENAEYKAALEHQEQLKARVSQLDDELKRARIMTASEVTIDEVGFGTQVRLLNMTSKAEETLTILGEWESDPIRHIISYKSPRGQAMLFKKIGDEFRFEVEGKETSYRILSIDPCQIG